MVLIIVQQHPNCLEGYSSLCLQNFTSGKLIFLMQPTTPKNLDTAIDNLLHPRIQNPFTYDNVHFLTFVGFNAFTYVSAPGRRVKIILCNLIQYYVPIPLKNTENHLKLG